MSQTAIIQETIVNAIYNGLCLTNEGQPCIIQNVDFGKLSDLVDAALSTKLQEPVGEPLGAQINRLAEFIMHEVPGEPSQSEGAIDTTIRLIRSTLAHQPVTEGWESVETAPKDEVVLLSWWDHHGKQWEYEAGLYGSTRGGWIHGQATYWKRISAPAALKSEGRNDG